MAGKSATAELRQRISLLGEGQYRQAMRMISASLKEQRSALKAASAEYKAADADTRSLAQQEQALSELYEMQQERIRVMTRELDRLVDKTGEQSSETIKMRTSLNYARKELADTTAALKQIRGAMDDAADGTGDAQAGIAELGESAGKASGGVAELADALMDAAGISAGTLSIAGGVAAAAGVAKAALDIGTQTQDAWAQLAASTGETGDNLAMLQASVQEIARRGAGEGLPDAADVVAQVYQSLGLRDEALTEAGYASMGIRDTFGIDTQESLRAVNALMHNFGIDSEDAYDLLATGAQEGANASGELVDTIAEYAPHFARAGKEAEEFIGLLVDASDAGFFQLDKVGDGFKELLIRLTSEDESVSEILKELGFVPDDLAEKIAGGGDAADLGIQMILDQVASIQDKTEQARVGAALFGTAWEDTAGKVLPLYRDMGRDLDTVEGTARKLADVRYDTLNSSLSGLKETIGDLVEPAVLAGVEGLTRSVDELTAGVAALDTLVDGGSWEEASQTYRDLSPAEAGRQERKEAAMESGMDDWSSSYFAAMGQLNEDGTVKQGLLDRAADWIEHAFSRGDAQAEAGQAAQAITQPVADALEALPEAGERAAQETGAAMRRGLEQSSQDLYAQLSALDEQITEAFRGGEIDEAYALTAQRDQLMADLAGMREESAQAAQQIGEGIAAQIGEAAQAGVGESMGAMGEAAAQQAQAATEGALDGTAQALREQIAALDEEIDSAFASGDTATGWELTAQREALMQQLIDLQTEAAEQMEQTGESMSQALEATDMSAAAETAAQTGIDGLLAREGDMAQAGDALGSGATGGLKGGLSGMGSAASSSVSGVVGSLRAGIQRAYTAGYETGQAYARGYKAAQRIASPSREMAELAEMSLAGVLEPLEAGEREIYARGAALSRALADGYGAAHGAQGTAQGAAQLDTDALADAVASSVRQALADVWVYVDKERVARLMAGGVSREISRQSGETIRGRSAANKAW